MMHSDKDSHDIELAKKIPENALNYKKYRYR